MSDPQKSNLVDLGPGMGVIDLDAQLADFERFDCERSLYDFLKAAWKYIDPAPFVDGWVIGALCEHLQAVVDGDIKRLCINQPPRTMKSTLASVALPAWTWIQQQSTPTSGPGVPFLYASYAQKLSVRDSLKCRRLIESPWYRKHWGKRWRLMSDQNAKTRFGNSEGGERLITSITSGSTGEGGMIIVVDDANAANEIESEATIETTNTWWDSTLSTRLNDPKTGAFIVVQQRLAEDDLTGHILETEGDEWTHLVLPMFFDSSRSFVTNIGWKDPRTEEGELLWPERFGDKEARALERRLGPWMAAGQLQQEPKPQGGGIIKRDYWQLWEPHEYPPFDYILASLDTAYTEKTMNDPSAMTVWGVFTTDPMATASRIIDKDGRPQYFERTYSEQAAKVMLMAAWSEHLEFHDLVEKVVKTCRTCTVDKLLIENKAVGITVAQELRRVYSAEGFAVQLHDPKSQDKIARLYSVEHIFAEGIVYAPDRKWAEETITEVESFPKGRRDDRVDTVSQALRHLRDMGLLIRAPERLEEIEQSKLHTGRPPARLYPV